MLFMRTVPLQAPMAEVPPRDLNRVRQGNETLAAPTGHVDVETGVAFVDEVAHCPSAFRSAESTTANAADRSFASEY